MKSALIIGNSDGIGLALTRALLGLGYRVTGISRSASPVSDGHYSHHVQDVAQEASYRKVLEGVLSASQIDLCVYCAGIGDALDLGHLENETQTFRVNLMAAVVTTELALVHMQRQGKGHFIGLSSIADRMVGPEAPSYTASKMGVSGYWEGLGLALLKTPVKVSNVRFGFVDTKMAKDDFRPMMISREKAALFVLSVIEKPRIRATKPLIIDFFAFLLGVVARLRTLTS